MIINKIHSNIHDSYLIVWLRWQNILLKQLIYTDLSILSIIRSHLFCKWVSFDGSLNFFIAWQMPSTKGRISKDVIRCYNLNISISMLLMSDKVDKYRVCKYNRAWYLRLRVILRFHNHFEWAYVSVCFLYPWALSKTMIWVHCQ